MGTLRARKFSHTFSDPSPRYCAVAFQREINCLCFRECQLKLILAIGCTISHQVLSQCKWKMTRGKVLHNHSSYHQAFPKSSFTKHLQRVLLGVKRNSVLKRQTPLELLRSLLGSLLNKAKCHPNSGSTCQILVSPSCSQQQDGLKKASLQQEARVLALILATAGPGTLAQRHPMPLFILLWTGKAQVHFTHVEGFF